MGKSNLNRLTIKQRLFCEEYVKSQNASQSAIIAGYPAKTARSAGNRLINQSNIKNYLSQLREEVISQKGVDIGWVMDKFITISERCMQEVPVLDKKGAPTGEYQFDSSGANKAVEMIGKMLGAFERDNKQKTEAVTEVIRTILTKAV